MSTSPQLKEVIAALDHLVLQLPHEPTAVSQFFAAPQALCDQALELHVCPISKLSQTFQQIGDLLALYLCLLESPVVRVVRPDPNAVLIDSSGNMHDGSSAYEGVAGQIQDQGFRRSEVRIVIHPGFLLRHALATLCHEYVHRYLDLKHINAPSSVDEERFVDITACYLGLGPFLIDGHYPNLPSRVGYVSPEVLRWAILLSCPHRGWHTNLALAFFQGPLKRWGAKHQLGRYKSRIARGQHQKDAPSSKPQSASPSPVVLGCPTCSARLRVRIANARSKVRCPKCGAVFAFRTRQR